MPSICENQQAIELCLQEALADETERKQLRRKPYFRSAALTLTGGSTEPVTAFCRDISDVDIGLLHVSPLEPGCEFQLHLPLLSTTLELQCRTEWCSPIGPSEYISGNTYSCGSTPQAWLLLSAVLSQQLHRRFFRRVPFWRSVTITDLYGTDIAAFSRDISQDGIGLLHRDPITSTRAILSIAARSGQIVVATLDVRWCAPQGLGWYISGGNFATEELGNAESPVKPEA